MDDGGGDDDDGHDGLVVLTIRQIFFPCCSIAVQLVTSC